MDIQWVDISINNLITRAVAFVKRKNAVFILAVISIVLVSLGVRLYNILGAGITCDEVSYVRTAAGLIRQLATQPFFSCSTWASNSESPPVGKYIYAIAIYLFNGSQYDQNAFIVSKMLSALMGTITCVIIYFIGRDFFDERVGLLAGLILALLPPFVAHGQIAALESPLVMFFTLTIYLFMTGVKRGSSSYIAGSAISLGLCIDTKLNGVLVIPVICLFFFYYRFYSGKQLMSLSILLWSIIYGILALNVIIWLWPYLWADPIILASDPLGPLRQVIGHWTYVPHEYFLGLMMAAPLYYYPVYFLVTTPLLLLPLVAAGLYYALRSRDPFKTLLVFWLIVPFAYGLSSFIQDGDRYILTIFPAVALLSAYGAFRLASFVSDRWKLSFTWLFMVVGAVIFLYLLLSVIAISPYYLDYYNSLAGGQKNIQEHHLFEIGWWGEGMTDSVKYVESVAPPGSTVLIMSNFVEPEGSFMYYSHNLTYLVPDAMKFDMDVYDMKSGNLTFKSYSQTLVDALKNANYIIYYPYQNDEDKGRIDASRYCLVHKTMAGTASICLVYKKTGDVT